MENVTKKLAKFIADTSFRDLPDKIVAQAKSCILDLIGVSLLGSTLKHSRILAEFVRDLGGGGNSSIIGYPFKTSPPYAGLVNGAIGHALQMDDGEMRSIAHIGTEVIPAALAVAEAEGVGGKDLLTATVLGYEAVIRIGAAVNPSHNNRGFSP
ncbi:MAG: MmgE/PrpD family protein, partial [Candidatus Hodarchaeota archaeon]